MSGDPFPFRFPFDDILGRLFGDEPAQGSGPQRPGRSRTPTLDRFGRDLTRAARDGRLDPVVGRDDAIEQTLEVLSRRTKNNPVLIGDPGVGKTAIAEGLAQRIVDASVPDSLRECRVVSVDLARMVAGTKYRGEFEERLTAVIDEVTAAGREVILFLDELHTVVGAGSAEGSIDAGNMLKPALARGELHLVGATTVEEYRKYIEKDPAFERRFQPILVPEPSLETTEVILRALRDRYQLHHHVHITDEALHAAAELSHRYIPNRFLPDKAIDLIDQASARVQLRGRRTGQEDPNGAPGPAAPIETGPAAPIETGPLEPVETGPAALIETGPAALIATGLTETEPGTAEPTTRVPTEPTEAESAPTELTAPDRILRVTAEDVAEVVSRATGIPVSALTEQERTRLLRLEDALHGRIVGQHEAVAAVAEAIRRGRAGLADPHRPVGSFLFLGPSGVGKTELARTLALTLFGDAERLTRFDMSEFKERHTVSRLIGAPPGYAGHDEPGQLTEAVRRTPYTVVLLDEIEKAHPDVANTLLQLLDAGRLTDASGRTVDFSNTVVILTSNVGAEQILLATQAGRDIQELRDPLLALLGLAFRPEFLNRVDEIILFGALDHGEVHRIAALLLEQTRARLLAQRVCIDVTPEALDLLAARGYRPESGARHLRRTIQRDVEGPLATMVLAGTVSAGSIVQVTAADGALEFEVSNIPA